MSLLAMVFTPEYRVTQIDTNLDMSGWITYITVVLTSAYLNDFCSAISIVLGEVMCDENVLPVHPDILTTA